MKKVIFLLTLSFAAFFVFIAWEAFLFVNKSPGSDNKEIAFEIKQGESLKQVSQRLEEKKLVSNAFRFYLFMRLHKNAHIRSGEYAVRQTMTPMDLLKIITSGHSIEYAFVVQEGLNQFEIAELYEKKGFGTKEEFIHLCTDPEFIKSLLKENETSFEGYLFPETYKITKFTGAKALIKQMVERFLKIYGEVREKNKVTMTRHELVTLASIIEKETGAPEERPLISSVYHNRLDKPMLLQADPTVIYGLWLKTGEFKKNITKDDLKTEHPYNTYVNKGLPLGPIANPGREALVAAGNPESSNYYYFVSRNDGTHVFSKDYKSHLLAVKDFQLRPEAREGKSWRDLKDKNSTDKFSSH